MNNWGMWKSYMAISTYTYTWGAVFKTWWSGIILQAYLFSVLNDFHWNKSTRKITCSSNIAQLGWLWQFVSNGLYISQIQLMYCTLNYDIRNSSSVHTFQVYSAWEIQDRTGCSAFECNEVILICKITYLGENWWWIITHNEIANDRFPLTYHYIH